jgi:hypothetical protein
MLAAACAALLIASPLAAQTAPAASQGQTQGEAQPPALRQAIDKSNAYIGLMNRTLRASDSWSRYRSWVKSPAGPTGKERIIYGLYGLYDVRGEIARARAAMSVPPSEPALDAAMASYIEAYEALAPLIGEAEGYYERKDYLVDRMAKGREIHARLAPAAQKFLAERGKLDAAMGVFKAELDRQELADLERREGKSARWQARNVMIAVRPVVDLLPQGERPVVDLAVFDAALGRYAEAVSMFDAYASANPGQFSVFESSPRSYLGKLREFRQKLGRAKGDARRAGVGFDLTWLVNDYNMMVSTSQSAIRFSR